jgi:uncharacterized protein
VDVERKRVSFTMRMGDTPNQAVKPSGQNLNTVKKPDNRAAKANQTQAKQSNQMMGNAFADAFAKAKK